MSYPEIKLKERGVKKVIRGALWLTKEDSLQPEKIETQIEPGSLVSLYTQEGHFLAQAYYNPRVFYSIKILCRKKVKIDTDFFYKKFSKAFILRKKFYPNEKCFRLVHSEGDNLPGLIIDIFDEVAVIQIYTLGMERLKNYIYPALAKVLPIKYFVFKNDFDRRKEENLEKYIEFYPKEPQDPYLVEMDGIKFLIPIKEGQKTGFFLDQRENRRRVMEISSGSTVIDAFSYIGGFSFYALKGGAKRVFLIDRSSIALEIASEIAKLNGWQDKVIPLPGDVFKILREYRDRADLVILDPPAFVKSKKDLEQGQEKYKQLYALGLNAFDQEEGFLFLFSCSHFLTFEDLKNLVTLLIVKSGKEAKWLYPLFQAPDHPINPSVPETAYLKGLWLFLSSNSH